MQQFVSYFKMTSLFMILVATLPMISTPSFLRHLLGSKPANETIQKSAQDANNDTEFETPVLNMNRFGKLFGYSSFNWFNTTWIDEEAVTDTSPAALKWQLIHEKWHTLAKHDIRRLVGMGMIAAPCVISFMLSYVEYMKDREFPILTALMFRSPTILATIFAFLWHEESCEHAADQYADRITAQKNNV